MNFVILTYARSGSTWLGSLLDSHPELQVYGELFLHHKVPEKYQEIRKNDPEKFFEFRQKNKKPRPFVTGLYLDHIYRDFNITQNKAIGFKLMGYPFLSHPELLFYLAQKKIKILHLKRNAFDRVISYYAAENKNEFHSLGDKNNDAQFKINTGHFLDRLRKFKKLEALTNAALKIVAVQKLSLDYDDLKVRKADNFEDLLTFLEVQNQTLTSPLNTSSSLPYSELIENYYELKRLSESL